MGRGTEHQYPPVTGWEAWKADQGAREAKKKQDALDRAERGEAESVPKPLHSSLFSDEDYDHPVSWQEGRPGAIKIYSQSWTYR